MWCRWLCHCNKPMMSPVSDTSSSSVAMTQSACDDGPASPLQLIAIVELPLTPYSTGSILCRTVGGVVPIEFHWRGLSSHQQQQQQQQQQQSLAQRVSEVFGLLPGRYTVVATDARGAESELTIDVEPAFVDAVVVSEYRVTHATTSHSRDGSVEVVGRGLGECRFFWTYATVTDGPILHDVPCGTYAATPLCGGVVLHQAAPAQVRVHAPSNM